MVEKKRDVRSADICLVFARAWAPLITAFLVVVACASAQCPSIGGTGNPHWTWNTLEWVYNGSLSTNGIYGAASAWNSGQSFTTISKSAGYWDDIDISDSTAVTGLGEVQTWTNNSGVVRAICAEVFTVQTYVSTLAAFTTPVCG